MTRAIVIHGHFYQPPREDPWTGEVFREETAAPYHDWNQRITEECYRPNTAARMLDGQGHVERLMDNYSRISFNFGPTLLSWMLRQAPEVHAAIVEADRVSAQRFAGHGSAMAQAYNHAILPLASAQDKRTQVRWGIQDFRLRFGRHPEGMWLPETAVDTATLEALAQADIHFTVLAPRQALRIRQPHQDAWQEVDEQSLDTRRPYRCRLPSGRSIALFFFDGPLSHGLAFGDLLRDGRRMAHCLMDSFQPSQDPQIVHLAADGETFGHHHRFGEMGLAACLDEIASDDDVESMNYGQYLERHPPVWEVEIRERTSWSCVHGVERWRSDCGCRLGGPPQWRQDWRGPLREALDALRDRILPLWEREAALLVRDPWRARDSYVRLIFDSSEENRRQYVEENADRPLSEAETTRLVSLMDLQRWTQEMYASCGWFFDEVSGHETLLILRRASRAAQGADRLFHPGFEDRFVQDLSRVPSNRFADGAVIYRQLLSRAKPV